MSEIQLILIVIAAVFAIWQTVLLAAFVRMVSNPKYSKVTVGIMPGTLAVIILVVAILL